MGFTMYWGDVVEVYGGQEGWSEGKGGGGVVGCRKGRMSGNDDGILHQEKRADELRRGGAVCWHGEVVRTLTLVSPSQSVAIAIGSLDGGAWLRVQQPGLLLQPGLPEQAVHRRDVHHGQACSRHRQLLGSEQNRARRVWHGIQGPPPGWSHGGHQTRQEGCV